MIIQTIDTVSQFRDAFRDANRQTQFSYEALETLFNFLEDVYSSENYELDVISICCEFTEYSEDELLKAYAFDGETFEEILQYVENNTTVLKTDANTYVVQNF